VTPADFASYCGLCLVQGAIVLLPRAPHASRLERLRARWPLLVLPVAALTGVTFLPPVASTLASGLSTLALVAVPLLALVAVAWAMRWRNWRLTPIVAALLALAWGLSNNAAGDAAGLVLVALSCVALGAVVAAVVPSWVAKVGIVAWAAADLTLALARHLEQASRAITEASPAVGPLAGLHVDHLQLQRVLIGPASMEYADLFVAAVLGAVLAAESRTRGPASLLVAAAAISLGAFFLVANVLPATVPVAVALGLEELRSHRTIGQMSPLRLHGRLLGG
jgi:hypothetical protein